MLIIEPLELADITSGDIFDITQRRKIVVLPYLESITKEMVENLDSVGIKHRISKDEKKIIFAFEKQILALEKQIKEEESRLLKKLLDIITQ